jgi:hypothetical protein
MIEQTNMVQLGYHIFLDLAAQWTRYIVRTEEKEIGKQSRIKISDSILVSSDEWLESFVFGEFTRFS